MAKDDWFKEALDVGNDSLAEESSNWEDEEDAPAYESGGTEV